MDKFPDWRREDKESLNFEEASTTEKKEYDTEHFNRRSRTYENSLDQRLWFDRFQRRLLNMVEKEYIPTAVLDVGCGTGRLLRKAKVRWPKAQFIGVDPAANMIENARRLMPDAKFYVSQAESLPLPDASVNLVFSTASYNFWQDKEKGLREIKRVLQVGGRLFLADIWPPLGLSRFIPRFQVNSPSALQETFSRVGFHIQDQRNWRMLWLVVTVGKRC
jgi:ubiquinone/menaquinone biosynthesis C-methylase UbiE